ncbi:MAG: YitT family protein [Bacillota bacterium]|jgi:uncharacterized membrane-anchored protein YitT (DUF2179 family)
MSAVKAYAIITLGVVIVALGLHLFLVPGNIAAGGAMGVAIVARQFLPVLSVGHIMLAVNVILFGLAFITVGLDFGIKTVYASLGLSAFLWVLEVVRPIEKPLVDDLLLATIMGVLISGLGMAIMFNQGSSSGGTDIVAKNPESVLPSWHWEGFAPDRCCHHCSRRFHLRV